MHIRDSAIEVNKPIIAIRTACGARVRAWLLIEDEDLIA
jgi:hypothetical protein